MDWIHCNKCFILGNKVSICITSCCHLLCKKCLQKQCPICNQTTKSVEINNQMPLSVGNYFEDIPKTFLRLKKTIKFQWEHRSRLEEVKSRRFEEIKRMKGLKEELERSIKNHEDTIKQESNKIRKFRAYVAHCKSRKNISFQTPPRTGGALRRRDGDPYSFRLLSQIDMNSSSSSSAASMKKLETPSFFAKNVSGKTGYSADDDSSFKLRKNFLSENRAKKIFGRGDDTGYHTPTTTKTTSSKNSGLESLRFGNLF